MKGNQTVNVNAGASLALSPHPEFFPWEHRPYDSKRPTHLQVASVPRGRPQAWESFEGKGDRVGKRDSLEQKAGPWEMYNLKTPIIIGLFFFVRENQYVHSEIIFSVNGWISFHP